MTEAKSKGRDHAVEDVPEKIQNAADKSKGGSWSKANLKKDDTVWVKGSAWANKAGAVCCTFLKPDGSPDEDRKQKIESLSWVRDGETPAPVVEERIVEVVPDKAKIKQELTAQYRELWERDARACSDGARDGSDVSACHVAMSELQKLSKKLRLGIDFSALDREAQERSD